MRDGVCDSDTGNDQPLQHTAYCGNRCVDPAAAHDILPLFVSVILIRKQNPCFITQLISSSEQRTSPRTSCGHGTATQFGAHSQQSKCVQGPRGRCVHFADKAEKLPTPFIRWPATTLRTKSPQPRPPACGCGKYSCLCIAALVELSRLVSDSWTSACSEEKEQININITRSIPTWTAGPSVPWQVPPRPSLHRWWPGVPVRSTEVPLVPWSSRLVVAG